METSINKHTSITGHEALHKEWRQLLEIEVRRDVESKLKIVEKSKRAESVLRKGYLSMSRQE